MQAMAENVAPSHGTDTLMNKFKPLEKSAAFVSCNFSLQSVLQPSPRWAESIGQAMREADRTLDSGMG
jgi:hypothetical protein